MRRARWSTETGEGASKEIKMVKKGWKSELHEARERGEIEECHVVGMYGARD